ncbi:MAG: 5-(carboxyamino)imidazole ribonucleotide mutase [Pirellulaceae bacterium]
MPSQREAETERSVGTPATSSPLVGVIMGSKSDWDTLRHAADMLAQFEVPHECRVVSAHRTPAWMCDYARTAEERGLRVIIAGAGGAAHLPGMIAAQTTLPVLGVPVQSRTLQGLDSLLSIVQMPGGIPVGTLAIGDAGAKNAALLALRILANEQPRLREQLRTYHDRQRDQVLSECEL